MTEVRSMPYLPTFLPSLGQKWQIFSVTLYMLFYIYIIIENYCHIII